MTTLQVLTQVLYVVVFIVLLRELRRRPNRSTLDATLFFAAIAVLVGFGAFRSLTGLTLPAIATVLLVPIALALPYLLLRLVDDYGGVRSIVLRAAEVGLVIAIVALVLLRPPYPVAVSVGLIAYFVLLLAYCAVAFYRGTRTSAGLTRLRMRSIAAGTALLALTIAVTAGPTIDPAAKEAAAALSQLASLGSALAFYLGFAPPGIVRRLWREPQLRLFLQRSAKLDRGQSVDDVLAQLATAMASAMGVERVRFALWNESTQSLRWTIDGEVIDVSAPSTLGGRAIRERKPMRSDDVREYPGAAALWARLGVRALLTAPIIIRDRPFAVVGVGYSRASLFVRDDLDFLGLLADQAAVVIENAQLVAVLEEASRAKSTFLANMSHELRTPLNAILGFTDLLEEQLAATLSDRQRTFVSHIRDAGQHLLALINDVLDLSKVEAGRLELRPERVSLRALVGPVIASAQADAATRDVAFSEEGLPDVELMVDAGRIRQVLYNLLSNAVKFTPAGGAVTLRATVNDRSLRLEVSDTGVGIPEAQQHRVFGAFERIHESLHTAPGTGLGLALTKQIVELHRGTISFQSVEGTGTRFTILLPDAVVPTITGARVLVVENDPGDAALVVALAAAADLQAEVVPTVEEALNALARETPLGVVLDLRLPGSRGEMLFEAMQRDPTMARVPVVVITVEEADSRNTKRLIGIDDYLTKPLDPARLAAWFKRLTERDP